MHQSARADPAVVDALLRASRALIAVAARSLAEADDITPPQFRALVVLSAGPASVSSLADALDVHSTTATRLCDRLVAKRLVRRMRDSEDRRAVTIHLTASGRRLVERVTERRRRDLAAIAERLPPDVAAGAVEALAAFADAAGERLRGPDVFGWSTAS